MAEKNASGKKTRERLMSAVSDGRKSNVSRAISHRLAVFGGCFRFGACGNTDRDESSNPVRRRPGNSGGDDTMAAFVQRDFATTAVVRFEYQGVRFDYLAPCARNEREYKP